MVDKLNIHESWNPIFEKHKELINNNLKSMYDDTELPIYPSKDDIFTVFKMAVKDIKIILLGQDPYHGIGQAHGLSFSVNKNAKIPPSLKNIYKEIQVEYPEKNYIFEHGNLEKWFNNEKIFLLNSSLSVIESKPGSLMNKWTTFTDSIIEYISENNENCIFLLLGNYAKEKSKFISNKDRIIYGVHPSPLSANRGFFGSNIFKKLDEKVGYDVNWSI
jgi:uracil-DNA glycosylase